MTFSLNPAVAGVAAPPIAAVQSWVRGRAFTAERPLLDVAQAVPSYPPADALIDHVAAVSRRPDTGLYAPILGLPALREAFAAHLCEDYGAALAPTDVAITAGCNQAFCVALSALAGPGDEVVLPLPYYFNHRMWLDMQGIRAVPLPFAADRGGVPTVEAVAAAITSRTRAVVLVSPSNPTGAEYPPALLEAVFALARERRIALVLDETYKDFRARPAPAHRILGEPGWGDTLVQLHSFSKSYSLAGYRVGAVVGGPRLLAEIEKLMDCVAICASRIGQEAALYGVTHLADWRAEKAALMRARMATLDRAFGDNRLGYRLVSAGAYFAYVRHPFEGVGSTAVAERLAREHAVLCVPGEMFGPGQEPYLRFAFANLEADRIPMLVERLVESQG